MDKNSIIGIVLIFLVLVVFSVVNQPSKEQIEQAKRRQDSIQQVETERARQIQAAQVQQQMMETDAAPDSVLEATKRKQIESQLGMFSHTAEGEESLTVLENNLVRITLTNRGGRISSVELKGYKTYDGQPLILFEGDNTQFGMNFFAQNRNIQTDKLYFTTNAPELVKVSGPEVKKGDLGDEKHNLEFPGDSKMISYRLEVSPGSFMEYTYTLKHNSWLVGFETKMEGMNSVIAANQPDINFIWSFDVPRQEKKSQFGEDRYTQIYYKFFEDDVDKLSSTKSEEKNLTRTKWIGLKQLFFTSTVIADESFSSAQVRSTRMDSDEKYLANFYTGISLPWTGKAQEKYGMQFYFGPNHFQTLRQYKNDMESQVYLGYAVISPVNRYLIIPVFNFLRDYMSNFGIIILLLTIFIKVILFPFTYKSYVSQAKMRVLKPELDEINAKFPADKAMDKQQAIMALYKKAGVNPMGGCLPMLLQMPILIAMFFFFPTSIELRQESFLWATDLSTYDSILDLPFTIPFYGDHVSLFTLLMTITTIISTRLNSQATAGATMPGMKTMMYMMPVMFMFILNSYSSGLSYYYFLANVITIGQTYIVRGMVDETKIRAQLMANKKKPVVKSKFQQRLEELAKQRGVQAPKKK
jgi:YidC/Oxa1 family membrane protein insertase